MKKRNPAVVALLSVITIGIYMIVWYVKTKNEMNAQGANIPTAWLIIIPFVNLYWLWKYSKGVEMVTNKRISKGKCFALNAIPCSVCHATVIAVTQNSLNKITDAK
jgi:hypothetical protein